MRPREPSQTHECAGDRNLQRGGKFEKLLRRFGEDDPAPGIEHRFFGLQDQIQGLGHLAGIGMIGGVAIAEMVTVSFRDIGEGIRTDQSLTLKNGEVYPLRKPADIALCITASLQEVSERMLDPDKMMLFERTVEAKRKLETLRAKERAKEVKGGGSGDRKEKRERQGQGGDNVEVK